MKRNNSVWLALVLMMLLVSCASKKTIRSDGLSFARLGEELPTAGIGKLKGIPVRDTLFAEKEYEWRVSALQYKKGVVFIEEDFYRSEMINRIRIETPELKLKNGWKVGESISTLKNSTSDWAIVPMQRFKLFDFYSPIFPRIHFVVEDPGVNMEDPDWKSYKIADFNPEAKVVMIVVY